MDPFVRFNRKSVDDRQLDTLIGLSKGLLADGRIDPAEAKFLHQWLTQARQCAHQPVIVNLLSQVEAMLSDGQLDEEEAKELLNTLQRVAGEPAEFGEIAKSSTLPLCDPAPQVTFAAKTFLFTGTCAYGTRKQCQDATEQRGGVLAKSVNRTLSFLVLGTYVTDSWIHETFGRKIEKAMQYRSEGVALSIISEQHWAHSGKL